VIATSRCLLTPSSVLQLQVSRVLLLGEVHFYSIYLMLLCVSQLHVSCVCHIKCSLSPVFAITFMQKWNKIGLVLQYQQGFILQSRHFDWLALCFVNQNVRLCSKSLLWMFFQPALWMADWKVANLPSLAEIVPPASLKQSKKALLIFLFEFIF